MKRGDLLTIDDFTVWWCEPHEERPDTWCHLFAAVGDMWISVPLPLDVDPTFLLVMLAKISAAFWMLCEQSGVVGLRQEGDGRG